MCPSMRAGANCQDCLLQWQQPLAAWPTQHQADRRTAAFHNVQAGGGGVSPMARVTHAHTHTHTHTHSILLEMGLEPTISSLGGRRLIH